MENENIQKLIEAISNSPEFQQQLQAEADKPVTRGPKDKGVGTALLSSIAQSSGVNLSSKDISQLTSLLSQIGSIAGNSSASSGGGLQLLNAGSSSAAQTATQSMGIEDLLSMFSGGSTQSANNSLLNLLGGSNQVQATQANANSLGNFLSLFSGGSNQATHAAQASSGLNGAAILKLLLKLLL